MIVIFLLLPLQYSYTQCTPSKYKEGFILTDSPSEITMYISIKTEDFAPDRMICLARALKKQHQDRNMIGITICDSPWAAKHYSPPIADSINYEPIKDAAPQCHGMYYYNKNKNIEGIGILPRGVIVDDNSVAFDTSIDLSISTKPQCKLQINNRCLIALKNIEYPAYAISKGYNGTVTLNATIDRSGTVKGVKVAEKNFTSAEGSEFFVKEAFENLQTWRFEKAKHEDLIHITYSYTSSVPKGHGGIGRISFDLPKQVNIRLE